MEFDEAMQTLKKQNMMDEVDARVQDIVTRAVEVGRANREHLKFIQEMSKRTSELQRELQELKETVDSEPSDPVPHPTQATPPAPAAQDYDTVYDHFVGEWLVMEEDAQVERALLGKIYRAFNKGSDAKGTITLYQHMRDNYPVTDDDGERLHFHGCRLKTYDERVASRRYDNVSMPKSGQTLLMATEVPHKTDDIVRHVIGRWLAEDLGTFHTAEGWLNIGWNVQAVRAMLAFRMQHIEEDSQAGRHRSIGRLLSPYVRADVEFYVGGVAYEMCSRTEGSDKKYALQPIQ